MIPIVEGSIELTGKGSQVQTLDRVRHDIDKVQDHRSDVHEDADEPHSTEQIQKQYEVEARHDIWRMSVSSIYLHHVQERKKRHKRVHLLCHANTLTLTVGRTHHWTSCKTVTWMIVGMLSRDWILSRQWLGFTQFTFLNSTPPRGYTWSEGRIDEDSRNVQARSHVASKMVKYDKEISHADIIAWSCDMEGH